MKRQIGCKPAEVTPLLHWPSFSFSLHLSHPSTPFFFSLADFVKSDFFLASDFSHLTAPLFFTLAHFFSSEHPFMVTPSRPCSSPNITPLTQWNFSHLVSLQPFCLQYHQLALATLSHCFQHFYSAAPTILHHLIICNLSVSWFCQKNCGLFIQFFLLQSFLFSYASSSTLHPCESVSRLQFRLA